LRCYCFLFGGAPVSNHAAAPTGTFAVGRAIYDWTDDANVDALAPVAGTKRELLVWIWYPAAAGQSAATDEYLPAPFREEVERDLGAVLADC